MSTQHKACAIFWEPRSTRVRDLKNFSTLRDLLSEGWRVVRVDCLPAESRSDTSDTTLIYILEKSDDEPEVTYSSEQLDHERRDAWQRGYMAGWRDQVLSSTIQASKPKRGRRIYKTAPDEKG